MESESQLIQYYLREGDGAALRELFGRHEESLFRYLWQMLRHQEDSEDALQDTLRKALKALPDYREQTHFKSWLFRIGHNVAIDLIRRRMRTVGMSDAREEAIPARDDGPAEALELKERSKALIEAVSQLPEHEREVVSLRLQADLSFREIAEAVGAPLGTVLARMHKGKQRLKTQLEAL